MKRNVKFPTRIWTMAACGILIMAASAGCSTDPPLRTGAVQPMDNKAKPTGKAQQGQIAAPSAGDVSK